MILSVNAANRESFPVLCVSDCIVVGPNEISILDPPKAPRDVVNAAVDLQFCAKMIAGNARALCLLLGAGHAAEVQGGLLDEPLRLGLEEVGLDFLRVELKFVQQVGHGARVFEPRRVAHVEGVLVREQSALVD